jgi:hypothetical protein
MILGLSGLRCPQLQGRMANRPRPGRLLIFLPTRSARLNEFRVFLAAITPARMDPQKYIPYFAK